jgi:hypothetical protein
MKDEKLIVYLNDISHNRKNLFIGFKGSINYLSKNSSYELACKLEDGENLYPLKINKKKITIPLDLIKDKNHLRIEITYKFKDFEKTTYLKCRRRKSIKFDDFNLDIGSGINSYLYLDIKKRKDNEIHVQEILLDSKELLFKGESKLTINEISLKNIINFEKTHYPVNYVDDNHFEFIIPYRDILNATVKKWEVDCDEYPNSIEICEPYEEFKKTFKIRISNSRNKILIEHGLFNIQEFDSMRTELDEKNRELSSRISEFRSRKVIRMTDSVKRLLR